MATPSKKNKKNPIDEALSAIGNLTSSYQPPSEEEYAEFIKRMLIGIKPGKGIIGTEEEERQLEENQSQGEGSVDGTAPADEELIDEADDEGSEASGNSSDNRSDFEADGDDTESGGRDTVNVPGIEHPIPVTQYFGNQWVEHITNLHSVEPLPVDLHMPTTPHDYQRKGAAQIDYLCKSVFRGCLIGDPMGLGKTLQAIMSMKLIKHEPGIIAVFCPANLCIQWVKAIEGAFDEGHGLSAFLLNDSSVSAHSILANRFDAVVCSFEFADANMSKKTKFENKIEVAAKNPKGTLLNRPTVAIATGMWALLGLPIKRGYIDEAQMVNKRTGKRHQSLMKLPVSSWCIMSGTLAHNKWYDISGYLDFIKGHPYTTDREFLAQFKTPSYTPNAAPDISGAQLYLLQRFLQAFIVMRPRDVLRLPPCHRLSFGVKVGETQESVILEWTEVYKKACVMDKKSADFKQNKNKEISALGAAIRCQLHGLHPRLAPASKTIKFNLEAEDVANSTAEGLNQTYSPDEASQQEKRRQWIKDLNTWTLDMFDESPHLTTVTEFLNFMVNNHPDQKIVVMSQYLKYLDIINLCMSKRFKVACLRYDGTVNQVQRIEVQKKFAKPESARPLLMTVGAGSVGLNLTSGKIVVILEQWWNISVENQGISRCHRQGAEDKVIVAKFTVQNSCMEHEIARVRHSKAQINNSLMKPLVHKHDEKPEIAELIY